MSETVSTATLTPSIDDRKSEAIRKAIIGDKVTIKEAAVALDRCDRTIYLAVERNPVPHAIIFGARYYELDDLARALVFERNTARRGRGRPRKSAA